MEIGAIGVQSARAGGVQRPHMPIQNFLQCIGFSVWSDVFGHVEHIDNWYTSGVQPCACHARADNKKCYCGQRWHCTVSSHGQLWRPSIVVTTSCAWSTSEAHLVRKWWKLRASSVQYNEVNIFTRGPPFWRIYEKCCPAGSERYPSRKLLELRQQKLVSR